VRNGGTGCAYQCGLLNRCNTTSNAGVNFDLSLFKSLRVRERVSAQFRFESFNTFNRVQFGAPGVQNGTAAFGVTTFQQNQPRKLQLAMKLIYSLFYEQ
jgi:hypothetical protein